MITQPVDRPASPREKTDLQRRIEAGSALLLAEIEPPQGTDPAVIRDAARALAGKVHALAVSDNRDRVAMSALAAAHVIATAGVEAVLHVTTRDRNRIALISEGLGAQALGVRNLLCTSGNHQTLGRYRAARNVFDIDAIQLLWTYSDLASRSGLVGEERIEGAGPFCLGAVAAPYADPIELQMLRLEKKIAAGAHFLITEPVYDLERFTTWWTAVVGRGLHEKAAFVANIRPLVDAEEARCLAESRPSPRIPAALLNRLTAGTAAAQRTAGLELARETIAALGKLKGLRGYAVSGDATLTLELLEKAAVNA